MSGTEFEGYEALVSELRATPPVAPERLRERVLELGPSARPRMSKRRRLVFVVVPVAAVLAVGAALVHGFVSSGSNQNRADAAALATGKAALPEVVNAQAQQQSARHLPSSANPHTQASPNTIYSGACTPGQDFDRTGALRQ